MKGIFYALAAAGVAYLVYETVITAVVLKRHPNRGGEGDELTGRVASVHDEFRAVGNAEVRRGSVQLNGAIWKAELRNPGVDLAAGDDCQVVGRDGLTLLVDRIQDRQNMTKE